MPLANFHPAVQNWFSQTFDAPSPPQEAGWPHLAAGEDTLICAPTGTGKTLTAFMACLDDLFRRGFDGSLPDKPSVVYVSPLKALSNDIEKNLREPLAGISAAAKAMGLQPPEIRVAVRTGDTPAGDRQLMLKKPPHILVTTPESLYILLTSQKAREMLRGVRTVIIDEIHAVARDKRGSHLSLSLERLEALCDERPQRVGLSATQKPVERVAQFLVGGARLNPDGSPQCTVVNLGHLRKLEISVEVPNSPLEAVCSHETWEDIYERLTSLIEQNRTTLIFVNTRALCERLTQHLSKRIGEDKVTSHHGSLSREQRLLAESRLKEGSLRALVATASLELGIDIGSIDLVCQIGPTHSISTLMQRVGRSGHSLTGISRGKIFALTLGELMSCAALSSSIKRGFMDVLHIPEAPIDILSQQIVAACAADEWQEDDLYALVRRAYPYRDLKRECFDEVVQMLDEGYAARRGRTGAMLHHDAIGKRLRGRRGARLAAITSGGAIPDNADYRVLLEPTGTFVGTLNEDFAVESTPNDIFQLGNTSWKILKIEPGIVRVEDAHGQPPTIPFWLGEAPARSDELSQEVSRLRLGVEEKLAEGAAATIAWIKEECGLDDGAAEQLYVYLSETYRVLGVLPSFETLVLERFFDESGGMQLVLHTPYGRRVNWAWGLALRKRFCRGFNFELQAAAGENSLLLSLGPQHSFPLGDVFHYLHSNSVEHILVQAALEAAVFPTRWRWDIMRALALLRFSGGKKVPPTLLRMRADDLMASIFPHAAACPENLAGEREVPDHPLVREVMHDCLHEAMDLDTLLAILHKIEGNELRLVARDTVSPSPLATEILTAKPYAFLDDAPLEERRTQAVITRRGFSKADELGALDQDAIDRVRDEAWPEPIDIDEMHDALMLLGYLTEEEAAPWQDYLNELARAGRATRLGVDQENRFIHIATECLPLFETLYPNVQADPPVQVPARERAKEWQSDTALSEIVFGRMGGLGPVTAARLAEEMALPIDDINGALMMQEGQGNILRGHFTPGFAEEEWCDRRLLARIHRYTVDRLRREIQPVTAAEYMRFLLAWQHVHPAHQLEGAPGVQQVLSQLQGYEISAVAWERDVLFARIKQYDRRWLDQLSLSGEIVWGRRFPAQPNPSGAKHSGQVRHAPVGIFLRDQLESWLELAPPLPAEEFLSGAARDVLEQLQKRGAMFFQKLVRDSHRLPSEVENALGELVSFGYVTGDGIGGLRALLLPPARRLDIHRRRRLSFGLIEDSGHLSPINSRALANSIEAAGRWSLFREAAVHDEDDMQASPDAVELVAWQLLRRWGVVFHRVIQREVGLPPWRDILRVYRRLEARGEVRGGRFVAGFSGEQYALPEAVEQLRALRKQEPDEELVHISGADPLNLVGIITPGDKVAARAASRIVYKNGVPIVVKQAQAVRALEENEEAASKAVYSVLLRNKA